MNSLAGWKTVIGMVFVLAGQVLTVLDQKWPGLASVGDTLINIGSAIGAVGVVDRVRRVVVAKGE